MAPATRCSLHPSIAIEIPTCIISYDRCLGLALISLISLAVCCINWLPGGEYIYTWTAWVAWHILPEVSGIRVVILLFILPAGCIRDGTANTRWPLWIYIHSGNLHSGQCGEHALWKVLEGSECVYRKYAQWANRKYSLFIYSLRASGRPEFSPTWYTFQQIQKIFRDRKSSGLPSYNC